MNNNIKIISVILFVSAFVLLTSCQQQKAEWKGTIEEVNGVIVVKNPKMPMYGEDVFSLEEDLSITDRGDNKKYFFTGLCSIAVDDKENIFLCDQREGHILKFDRDGNYIRKIGGMGKGPGEFNAPTLVICTSQREIAVNDRDQLSFFSLDGDFLRSLPKRRKSIYTIDIDNEGNIYGSKRILEKESPRWELQKFDSELNYLYTVTSTPYYIIGRKITPFPLVLRWDLMSDGRLVSHIPHIKCKYYLTKSPYSLS